MTDTHDDTTKESPKNALVVVNLTNKVLPHMSDAAKRALEFNRHVGWSNDLVNVTRMWDHEPDDADLRQLGADVSTMVEHLAARTDLVVDGLLATPMLVPLVPAGHYVAMMLVRVVGADQPVVRDRLRDLLPGVCGLHALKEGQLPPCFHPRAA